MAGKERNAGFLKKLLHPYRLRILLLTGLSAMLSVVQVSMAVFVKGVLSGDGRFWFWATFLVADILLQLGIYILSSWLSGSTVDRFCAALRQNLLKNAVFCDDARLQAYHSGALLSRGMEDVSAVCDGVITALPQLVGQVSRLLCAFAAVLLIWPSVFGFLLAAAVLAAAGVAVLRPVLKGKHKKVREADEKVMSTMQEDLQHLELIQSLGCQKERLKGFSSRLKDSLKAKARRRVWTIGSNSILSGVSLLGTGAILLVGAAKVAEQQLDFGTLTAMLQLLSQVRGPVLGISGLWTRFAGAEVSAARLQALLQASEQSREKLDVRPSAVVFENVTFRYPGDDLAVVEDFSMEIPLNGWTSLSGFSGRGKTTLFKLILGLYRPQTGAVYLRCAEGKIPCSAATRHLFAYVPQDYALFSGTVMDNLLLVAPEAGEGERREALEAACADFVYQLADGENTHVGENNTGLSKGQLQRIAIARALLMERPVLLLDECTSALDGETERHVLENLSSRCPSAILVTHRPETMETISGIQQITMEE